MPDAWWWVKADGCDLITGLKESTKREWSGDVNLNNGKVAKLHGEYITQLRFIEEFGRKERKQRLVVLADLCKLQEGLFVIRYCNKVIWSKLFKIKLHPILILSLLEH